MHAMACMNCWPASPRPKMPKCFHRSFWPLALAVGLCAAASVGPGSCAAISAATTHTRRGAADKTSPRAGKNAAGRTTRQAAARRALRGLSSEDFHTRQQALHALQRLLAHHVHRLVRLQQAIDAVERHSGGLLRRLAGPGNTPEARGRGAALLRFNTDLSRWGLKVLTLRGPQRKLLLHWGFERKNLRIAAALYSHNEGRRLAAIRQLAKNPSRTSTIILALLVAAHDQAAHLTAISYLWKRPANTAVVNALWARAISDNIAIFQAPPPAVQHVNVHGQNIVISPYMFFFAQNYATLDSNIATDLLVHLHTNKLVRAKVVATLRRVAKTYNNATNFPAKLIAPEYGGASINFVRMLMATHPPQAVSLLMQCVRRAPATGFVNNINGQQFYFTSVADPLALIVKFTHQSPAHYNLVRVPMFGNRWGIHGGPAQQQQALKRINAWWKKNGKKYKK